MPDSSQSTILLISLGQEEARQLTSGPTLLPNAFIYAKALKLHETKRRPAYPVARHFGDYASISDHNSKDDPLDAKF